jgi:phage terminase large subunit GpA-like protein
MEIDIRNDLLQSFTDSFETPYTGSVYEWANENVDLHANYAVTGRFNVYISKYLIQPFEDLKNKSVHQVNLVAATQTGKTLVSELFVPYIIINAAGPVLKLSQTDEMSNLFMDTRLIPLLEKCKPVKALLDYDRFSAKKGGVFLPHMSMKCAGAKESVLHGQSIRYLLADEVWLYDPDVMTKARARTTAFSNKKILITSQPGIENDQLDNENRGLIYEWAWKCPDCNNYQSWHWSKEKEDGTWAGIIWDKKYLEDSSSYDYERTGDTARLQCYHCSSSLVDNEENRRYLNDTGKYVLVKDNGDHKVHTYTWCAFVNQKISFKEKVIQYLQAVSTHKRYGTTDALRIFRQQVLGQPWKRNQPIDAAKVLTSAFNINEQWPEEILRCLTVDYQQKLGTKFYTVVAFSKTEIRVLEHSFCATWDQIAEVAKKFNIKAPAVAVDSGFNASEVYDQSVSRCEPIVVGRRILLWGWSCLKGEGQHEDGFTHKAGDGRPIKKWYSPEIRVALNNNQFARLYLWANLPIKTMLAHIRDNKSDIKMVLPNTDADWERHMNSETLEWVQDAKTGLRTQRWVARHSDNHWLDCMCMALVMAHIRGVFSVDVINTVIDKK